MGQQCCHFEDWDHLKIEASYKVEKDSPLSMPCCNSKKQYVVRDEENGQHVKNIDVLFDEVDNILSSSALTPLWFILPILIGGISHGIMFAYEAAGYLYWIPWVLPNALLIQPMWWYYISKRSCGLKNAINKWNSSYGVSQGIEVQAGIEDKVYWQYFSNSMTNWLNCRSKEMGNPMLHVCKNVNAVAM